MPTVIDIPVEVLIDNFLPLLPVPDILTLGCTNRFFYLLTADETFWHRKLQQDYNFSGSETARTTGWKFIYKRLRNPQVYVWGEANHGRLGTTHLPKATVHGSVPFPIHLRIPGVRVVSLVAGGWSFHALDSKGAIYIWGTLDATSFALRSDGFSTPAKRADGPMLLELPVPIRSISCGRLHSAALDNMSTIWIFTSWGRPFRLTSPLLDKSSPESTPVQVECGWSFTSLLTQSGDVLVCWPFSGRMHEIIEERNHQFDQNVANSKAIPTSENPDAIPCHTWDLENVDPVRLPPIPTQRLPDLLGTGLSEEEQGKETRLIKIAGMDNNIIGLTNKGHVLKYGRLEGDDTYQRGQWEYLPYFSEVEKVREDAVFSGESEHPLEPPHTMHITHISAHFRTFIAYSTGPQSVVLISKFPTETEPAPSGDTLKPLVHPTLQYQSVISVVLGDYHYGALTSTGKLLTWGAFSKGALGLGDPAQIPVGQPGGFHNERLRQVAIDGGGVVAPFEVKVPTEVRFDHGVKKKREKFCFAAAAAGWHMGALVIDLEPDEAEEEEEEEPDSMPGGFPPDRLPRRNHLPGEIPIVPLRGRGSPFRIGFAGRGGFRGGPPPL